MLNNYLKWMIISPGVIHFVYKRRIKVLQFCKHHKYAHN